MVRAIVNVHGAFDGVEFEEDVVGENDPDGNSLAITNFSHFMIEAERGSIISSGAESIWNEFVLRDLPNDTSGNSQETENVSSVSDTESLPVTRIDFTLDEDYRRLPDSWMNIIYDISDSPEYPVTALVRDKRERGFNSNLQTQEEENAKKAPETKFSRFWRFLTSCCRESISQHEEIAFPDNPIQVEQD